MVRLSRVDHVRLMVSHSVRKCSIRSESALSNETNDSKKLCIFPACNCCSSLVLHMNKFVTGIQVEYCRQTASSQHRGNCACSIYWSSILRSEKPTLCTCTRWPKNHPPSSYTIIYQYRRMQDDFWTTSVQLCPHTHTTHNTYTETQIIEYSGTHLNDARLLHTQHTYTQYALRMRE